MQEKQESHRKLLDELLNEIKDLYVKSIKFNLGSSTGPTLQEYSDEQPALSEIFGEIRSIKEKSTKYRNILMQFRNSFFC